MTTAAEMPTKREAAELANAEYQELTKVFMDMVDLFDSAQDEGQRINVPAMRKALGPKIRKGGESHALALSWLVDDDAPEYAEQLVEYADSLRGVERIEPAAKS